MGSGGVEFGIISNACPHHPIAGGPTATRWPS